MHASASRLVLVLLLIGWKSGANLLSQSCSVVIAKPITFRHSNENRSITMQKGCYNILALFQSYSHVVRSKQVDSLYIKANWAYTQANYDITRCIELERRWMKWYPSGVRNNAKRNSKRLHEETWHRWKHSWNHPVVRAVTTKLKMISLHQIEMKS